MTPLPLQFCNTLTRTIEPFVPQVPGQVKLYVCGPTVYDQAHLGHARCYITWDILYRTLQWAGYQVTYARNITDVDDKILAKARQLKQSPMDVAATFYQSFQADMARLNILPPTLEPKATDHIHGMQAMIQTLLDKGFAYVAADGSVYYRTQRKTEYGELSHKSQDSLQAGARVEVDTTKEHPHDFALWKAVTSQEAAQPGFAWTSPWGLGRPGWHIECSSMIADLLGEQIDIHAGGADLMFPHHENEIAQSEACTGKRPFVRVWMHNGFVNVQGEKMSKSLGNFSTIDGVLTGFSANAVRYFLLSHHYRMPVDFTEEALTGAENWTRGFHRQWQELGLTLPESVPQDISGLQAVSPELVEALSHDLNTPKALAALNGLLKTARQQKQSQGQIDPALEDALEQAVWLLGFQQPAEAMTQSLPAAGESDQALLEAQRLSLMALAKEQGVEVTADADPTTLLNRLVQARQEAKQARDWGKADGIRQGLQTLGWMITDLPDKTSQLSRV